MTRFLLNCSWTKITFSVPLTMKYPPGSRAHSFICAICLSVFPVSLHFELRNMIGSRPIAIPLRATTCLPRTYFISTRIGAAYVISLNRHSFGVTSLIGLRPSSYSTRSGSPIWISVYLDKRGQHTPQMFELIKLTLERSDYRHRCAPFYSP